MPIPCIEHNCQAYNQENGECGVLRRLQEIQPEDGDSLEERDKKQARKSAGVYELLDERPCKFSPYILKMARSFIGRRDHRLQTQLNDIHNDVVVALIQMDFRRVESFKMTEQSLENLRSEGVPDVVLGQIQIMEDKQFPGEKRFLAALKTAIGDEQADRFKSLILKHVSRVPTYEDFRRYVTTMTRNEVDHKLGYHCGKCAFFVPGSRGMSGICGNSRNEPIPGQRQIQVGYSTKPKDVLHGAMLLISEDDILAWPRFCSKLSEEGGSVLLSPSRRIWELLPQEMREMIIAVAQTSGIKQADKTSVVGALNDILERRDFYQERDFEGVDLTDEAKALLGRSRTEELGNSEIKRLNRLLLESSYPQEIAKSPKGCPYYNRIQFVPLDGLKLLAALESFEVRETLEYMEKLGPRQRHQALLIRLTLEGYTRAEIAEKTGEKDETNISKKLRGESKKEDDGAGNKIKYHQAGAVDVFRAIYTGAIFRLRKEQPNFSAVVDRRDFSPDERQPRFDGIGRELDITNRQAVERYKAGWLWINTQGGGENQPMNGGNDDKSEEKIEQSSPRYRIAAASEMQHPDFHALLSYAEDGLDREARKLIAAHVLICCSCSAELEHIETEVLPEMDRPISLSERLSWLAARLVGRIRGALQIEQEDQIRILLPAYPGIVRGLGRVRGERRRADKLVVQGAGDTFRFLTVLSEDEEGELYLFMSSYESASGERKGPVYCWPVESAQVTLPFAPDQPARHRYQAYLTDREVPVPQDVRLDSGVNDNERSEERRRLVAAFLETLERGEIKYRAAEQEVKP
jgi:hypothetical protein